MAKRTDTPQGVELPQAPYIHPGVAPSAADAYAAGIQARRAANSLPKTNEPVAGGPTPPIPRLDGGMPPQLAQTPQQAFVERPQPTVQMSQRDPGQLGILPMDILPDSAKEDPEFIGGHGSMFAANQPKMALRHGVVRNGKHLSPQQMVPHKAAAPGQLLRPETVKGLEELNKYNAGQVPGTLQTDKDAEDSVSDAARAAARVGELPGPRSQLDEKEREELKKTVQGMDEFEFDTWRQSMMKDLLNSPDQKTLIESRVKEMDVGDLITQGFIIQEVPIVPHKFTPAFKTVDGETDLAIKRLIMEDANSLEVSDRYYLDKFSLMSVAAALYSINGKPLLDHRDDKGNFNDELFRKKFTQVLRLPMHMLASLGVNAFWFDTRVRKLFVAEKLGNG